MIRMVPAWERILSAQMIPEFSDTADKMEKAADQLVPVDEGELKASLRSELRVDSKGEIVAVCYATADHAPFVEYGTSRMAAQPYLRPALIRAAREKFRFG